MFLGLSVHSKYTRDILKGEAEEKRKERLREGKKGAVKERERKRKGGGVGQGKMLTCLGVS